MIMRCNICKTFRHRPPFIKHHNVNTYVYHHVHITCVLICQLYLAIDGKTNNRHRSDKSFSRILMHSFCNKSIAEKNCQQNCLL